MLPFDFAQECLLRSRAIASGAGRSFVSMSRRFLRVRPRNRWIGWFQSLSFWSVSASSRPHMPALDNARDTSLGTNSFAEIVSTVGAVSKDLTRIIGQRIRASPAVIDIGRGNGNLFDQCGIGISANMCPSTALQALRRALEAVNSRLSPVFDPHSSFGRASPSSSLAEAMIVASTNVPVLTVIALALS